MSEQCDTGTTEKPCGGCPDCGPSSTRRTPEAISARLGKVSDGPWTAWDRGIGYEVHGPHGEPINDRCRETFTRGDAEFIAAAPSDVAFLLDLARKQQVALDGVLTELERRAVQYRATADGLWELVRQRHPDRNVEDAQRYEAYANGARATVDSIRNALEAKP